LAGSKDVEARAHPLKACPLGAEEAGAFEDACAPCVEARWPRRPFVRASSAGSPACGAMPARIERRLARMQRHARALSGGGPSACCAMPARYRAEASVHSQKARAPSSEAGTLWG
jgi:hypothetical protein